MAQSNFVDYVKIFCHSGKGGSALKKMGTAARIDMEDFFQTKVYLKLFVKVDPDWRENKRALKRFGYEF